MGTNHSSLAEQFARGATKGKASNMFIEDDTIYSYGKHFPIAKRLSHNEYLVNSDSYSNSTARHTSSVCSALRSKITWGCPNCDSASIPDYIKEKSTETFNKIQTANSNISHYINNLNSYENYWNKCKARFKFRNSKIDKMFKSFTFNDKVKAKIAKYELVDKFIQAVRNDNIKEVAECIKAGVNVGVKSNLALQRSISNCTGTNLTKLLLDNGAKVIDADVSAAIRLRSPDTIKLLLNNGGKVSNTHLNTAIRCDYPEIAKLLLEYGAGITAYDQFNYIKENVELTNKIKGMLLEFELEMNSRK